MPLVALNFLIAADAISIAKGSTRGLNTVDFSGFPSLSGGDANSTRNFVNSQTNIYLGYAQNPGKFYDQSKLNSILRENKYELTDPKFLASGQPNEFTNFGNDVVVNESSKFDNRNGGFECKPTFSQPIFNPYPLTFKSPAEFCSHYPLIDIREANGSAKNGRYSENLQDWESIRKIKTGELYYGLLYVSNGAATNLSSDEVDIHNAKIQVTITTLQNGKFTVEGNALGDNTSSISAALNLQAATDKQIIIGDSIEIFDYQGKFPPIKKIDKSSVLQLTGNKTIFEIPIGDLKPGFATDLFIRFNFIVK